MGQLCEHGTQLRPDVVKNEENVHFLEESRAHIANAGKVLVVGTSLSVFPVANLVKKARGRAEKVLVSLDMDKPPFGYRIIRGKATEVIPALAARWLLEAQAETNAWR